MPVREIAALIGNWASPGAFALRNAVIFAKPKTALSLSQDVISKSGKSPVVRLHPLSYPMNKQIIKVESGGGVRRRMLPKNVFSVYDGFLSYGCAAQNNQIFPSGCAFALF